MRVVAGESGFGSPIAWGRIQRPGLAFAGFLPYIKPGRIQILGESELNYLDTLRRATSAASASPRSARCRCRPSSSPRARRPPTTSSGVPAAQDPAARFRPDALGRHPADHLLARGLARALDHAPRRAPRRLRHGRPAHRRVSGVGKSECALDLVAPRPPPGRRRRGRDPPVSERRLVGDAAELLRHHMELRGIGIINIKHLFGVSAVRVAQVGRPGHRARALGSDQEVRPPRAGRRRSTRSSSVSCRYLRLPVASGRNLALLIEIAARNHLLKTQGYDAAQEFARRSTRRSPRTPGRRAEAGVSGADRPRPRRPRRSPSSLVVVTGLSGSGKSYGHQVPRGHGLLLRRQPAARSARAAARPGHRRKTSSSASSSTSATPTSPQRFPEILARLRRARAGRAPALPGRLGGVADPPLLGDAAAAPARRKIARCSRRMRRERELLGDVCAASPTSSSTRQR